MTQFFTQRLLDELDHKPALEAMEEALRASRNVGFDYVNDEEAAAHFRSEADEVVAAFLNESSANALSEAGDLEMLLAEFARRRGGTLVELTKANTRKFLLRLNHIEQALQKMGKHWGEVTWPDDLKPLWDDAKRAGL